MASASASVSAKTALAASALLASAPAVSTPVAALGWAPSPALKLARGQRALRAGAKLYNLSGRCERQGACSRTRWAQRGGIDVVLKELPKEEADRGLAETYALDRSRGHPNIVQLLDMFANDRGQTVLVLEAWGRDMQSIIRTHHRCLTTAAPSPLGPPEVRSILRQLLAGVLHLHTNLGLIHADIKPDNFLAVERHGEYWCKISDLGQVVKAMSGWAKVGLSCMRLPKGKMGGREGGRHRLRLLLRLRVSFCRSNTIAPTPRGRRPRGRRPRGPWSPQTRAPECH